MRCPFCKTNDARVVDSRETEGGMSIRRRRECVKCAKRFTTYEKMESTIRLRVIKKDGAAVPYDRSKILSGLEKATYKRPVNADQLLQLVERVEERLASNFERQVPATKIGEYIMDELRRIDQVAYVRFASVYREFRDVDEFIDEAREVMERQALDNPDQKELFEQ